MLLSLVNVPELYAHAHIGFIAHINNNYLFFAPNWFDYCWEIDDEVLQEIE